MKTKIMIAAMVTGMMLPALDVSAQGRGEPVDFATLDLNSDGTVTLAELEAQGAARFTAADSNNDGQLSQNELEAQIVARAEGRAAEAVERMLEHLDANGDGNISQDELPDHSDRATRMFERADANEDGAITADEFDAAHADRDGHGRGERHGHGDNEGRSDRGRHGDHEGRGDRDGHGPRGRG